MRNMSFSLTTKQVEDGTKDVTRRIGWLNLRIGEVLNACEKVQGLGKGEKIVVIRQIRVAKTNIEQLDAITPKEVKREGFPNMTVGEFVKFFCESHKGVNRYTKINRIEFEYV